uniref:Uncharacterized protein n=1 Tax=Romanomermis culicivorax TaxID=13658 RepID=A0A915HIF4_ROMCU
MVDHAPGKAIIRPVVEPVVVGSDANLTCAADDPGSPLASYRWKRPSQQNFTFSSDGRSYLIIESAKLTDSGEYACQPYNEIGMGEIGTYYLIVHVPAQIEQGPKQTESKTENDTGFFLTCTASGHPAPNITWFKDGVPIFSIATANNHWESFVSADDMNKCENNVTCLSKVTGRLEWKSDVRWSDKGVYECQAYNGAGSSPARAPSLLSVSHRPVIINNPTRPYVAADLKDTAAITCRSTARPEPKFRWSKDNNEIVNSDLYSISVKRLNEADDVYESSLIIKNVQDQEMGEYACVVGNQLGQADFKFTLQPKCLHVDHTIKRLGLMAPTKPTFVSNIRVVESAFTSMIVGWTPGFDGGSQQMFVVELTQTSDGKIRIYNATSYHYAPSTPAPSPTTSPSSLLDDLRRIKRSVAVEQVEDVLYNITGLLPGSEYKIRVRSVNSLGETEFSPSLQSSTIDAPLEPSLPKASEAVYNSDSMTIKFKPTNIDQTNHCLLLYRQMTSGKFSAESCFPPDTGFLEHIRPANNFKVRFCSKDKMVCGPEVDVLTGAESPLSWPIIVAVVVCLLALIMVCLGVLIYCFRSRRSTVTKKTSPQMSVSSSIVGGRVVNQQVSPRFEENDLSAANRHTPSLNENVGDIEANGKRHASKDSGLYTPTNGTLPVAPVTSSSNPYDLQRYSSEPMDLTPKKNQPGVGETNYEGTTVKNGQRSSRPTNRAPSYDDNHHEHWGATDGYGLNSVGANLHHHHTNGSKIATNPAGATPMVNMSPNGDSGDPSRQYNNQNDGNSINSDYSNPRRGVEDALVYFRS